MPNKYIIFKQSTYRLDVTLVFYFDKQKQSRKYFLVFKICPVSIERCKSGVRAVNHIFPIYMDTLLRRRILNQMIKCFLFYVSFRCATRIVAFLAACGVCYLSALLASCDFVYFVRHRVKCSTWLSIYLFRMFRNMFLCMLKENLSFCVSAWTLYRWKKSIR